MLVYYGYHFSLLKRKHMLYLVYLFERYYEKNELVNDSFDSNDCISMKIEEALQYNIFEHQDYSIYSLFKQFSG